MLLTHSSEAQLDELLGTAIADFDIPEDVYLDAVARYKNVVGWLSDYWDASPDDGILYPQGSFRLGTVVQPVNADDEYDIDFVCRRDLAKDSVTQTALKLDVGHGLQKYAASGPDGSPTLGEGKRCWTLDYPREPFHIDVLPALPDPEAASNAILLTDKDLRAWQHSNPIDFASWFHARMRQEFVERRKSLAEAKRMDVADVPSWRVKTTLQRAVQALKRHRDLYFSDRPDDRPASIIITTLAAQAYRPGGHLYEVLADVTRHMPDFVECRDGVYWIANPVLPAENFADRWRTHPGRDHSFFEWIERAQADLTGLGSELGVDRVLEKIGRSLGKVHADRAGATLGSAIAGARNAGALGIGATGLLVPATRRAVPQHIFHGGPFPGRDA